MPRVAIGLGSNLGDREAHLHAAVKGLEALGASIELSPVYETAPIGGPEQGPYLNAVVVLHTELPPRLLLAELLAIEQAAGRERRQRWGPRTLDLDILLYDDLEIHEPGLTLPHPGITLRRFVLQPLIDVWPAAALPDGTPLARFLTDVADQEIAVHERHET